MQILITDVIDSSLIIGVTAVFLFADIIAKNRLKIGLKDIGADLALGAFVIQLAFLTNLITTRKWPECIEAANHFPLASIVAQERLL